MKINEFLQKTEIALWNLSCIPVINCIAGTGKVLLGVVQLIAGIAIAIFSAPFTGTKRGFYTFKHIGLWHTYHGIANIVSGVFLTIPIFGNGMAYFFTRNPKPREDIYSQPVPLYNYYSIERL